MNGLAPERGRDRKRSAIYRGARRGSIYRADVTHAAPDFIEQLRARPGTRRGSRGLVSRGSLRRSHEAREGIYIIVRILGVRHRVVSRYRAAHRGALGRKEAIRYAHLAQIGLGRKGEKARVLVLPPEAPYSHRARRLQHRHVYDLSPHV